MTDTIDTDAKPSPDTRLEFYIQQSEAGSVAATAPVRWCVSKALIQGIEDRNFVRPQLIIVVRALAEESYLNEKFEAPKETAIYVVPLTRELEYVTFRRPGPNEIRAVIVDANDADAIKHIRNIRWSKPGRNEVFNDDGTPTWSVIKKDLKYIELSSSLKVEVPKEMFAPPPPEWINKLVRRFFTNKDDDQCHFRRRTILSVIRAFFLLTFCQLLKVSTFVIWLLFGARDLEPKELLHPWKGEVFGPINTADGTLWWQDKHGNFRPSPLITINPVVLLAIPAFVYGCEQLALTNYQGKDPLAHKLTYPGWWETVLKVDAGIIGVTLGLTLLLAAGFGLATLIAHFTKSETHKERLRKLREKEAKELRSKVLLDLEKMTCTTASAQVSLDALSEGKRTVHLRFSNFKTKVCKPFAS